MSTAQATTTLASGPPIRTTLERDGSRVAIAKREPSEPGGGEPLNVIEQGQTQHFVVAYDDNVTNGSVLAQSVLDNCENYYAALKQIFGGVEPPPGIPIVPDSGWPFHVHIRVGTSGATHGGCNNTSLWIDAFDGGDTVLVDHLVVSEADEVFMAAQGKSWDCGSSQGEALSRLLAYDLTGFSGISGPWSFLAAGDWLNSPTRPDFVSYNDPTDGNFASIGCGTLFINYIRNQRGIPIDRIVQVADTELSTTLHAITGDPGDVYPFPPFRLLMHLHYPEGVTAVGPPLDNPFPLDLRTSPLSGLVHLQDVGDVGWMNDKFNGTIGQSRRLEGFGLQLDPAVPNLGIRYMAHVENVGDTGWEADGAFIGTRNQGLRLEGFAIELTGGAAGNHTVTYMANVQDVGLTAFGQDGQYCGTRGLSKRVEGMLVHVQPR